MHVLVATAETQGDRPDDFFHAIEGELVMLPVLECADRRCGCRWSFTGISSHRMTTTAKVVDRPDLDYQSYRDLLLADAVASSPRWDPLADDEWLDDLEAFLEEGEELAKMLGVGAVVGRSIRDDHLECRADGVGGLIKDLLAQMPSGQPGPHPAG